jgi:hypothetical protein
MDFFSAQHTVNLKSAGGAVEINTQVELETIIAEEKETILADKKLRAKFNTVEKQLSKNIELRELCHYLQDNEAILSRLNNVEQFREDVVKSYLKANEPQYLELIQTIESVEARQKEIEAEAGNQRTQWDEVIAIFNDRFFVPFELTATNKIAVMLGGARIAELSFTYKDGADSVEVDKPMLMKTLSTGERKRYIFST